MQFQVPLLLIQQSSPSAPPSGFVELFAKSDNSVSVKDASGAERALTSKAFAFFMG